MAKRILEGRAGSSGLGIGRLVRVVPQEQPNGRRSAGGSGSIDRAAREQEQGRLRIALGEAATQLARLARETGERTGPEIGAIFEAQALFAADPGLVEPALAAIAEDGLSAAEAIAQVAARQADVIAGLEDEYFRARAADIRDVGKRVVGILEGQPEPELHSTDGTPAVLAADDLDASLVAAIRPELVAGIALAGGAPTGHAAIVARALGIPLVLGLGNLLAMVPDGAEVLVDGTHGRLLVGPEAADSIGLAAARNGTAVEGAESAGQPPSLSLPVEIEANAGSVREVELAAAAGASGIGLLRTELLFLGRTVAPGLDEQRSLYRRIRAAMPRGEVVFRTLDVGGDKPAAYNPATPEANPALGVRGVRLGLRHPDLLEVQLRALLESAPDGRLDVMFPMVATLEEVEEARAALRRAEEASRASGTPIATEVRVGIMIEVPAAALLADALAPAVDFFSIGTNDLVQYTMAADRTSAELADLASALQPAVLRLIAGVCRAAAENGRPVAVCGEAAANPLVAPILVGLGVTHLSVAAQSVPTVRTALAGLTLEACRDAAQAALRAATVREVRSIADALARRREPSHDAVR